MSFFTKIKSDISAANERDPAARNILEILINYPGFHAIFWHRIASIFWGIGLRLIARIISNILRTLTGIEIHPAATIKEGFFAVIRYSGRASDTNFDKHSKILEKKLNEDNVSINGLPIKATYDSPFTLPLLRRNEAMINVEWNKN